MDQATLDAYDSHAAEYAREWSSQSAPADMYQLIERYFEPGLTADVGCGSGRDAGWLAAQGYEVRGYDGSAGLIARARADHPALSFEQSLLPALPEAPSGVFRNVLCETVIMHLPAAEVEPAVTRLVELLQPGGVLYLSWRMTSGDDLRDQNGRLYGAFDAEVVHDALAADTTVLFEHEALSESSGKRVRRVIAQRNPTLLP